MWVIRVEMMVSAFQQKGGMSAFVRTASQEHVAVLVGIKELISRTQSQVISPSSLAKIKTMS